MCVGSNDVDRLFIHSLRSCLDRFDALGQIYLVADAPGVVRRILADHRLDSQRLTILADQDVLPAEFHSLPGWCRQQAIKLLADTITESEFIACTGADTIILQTLHWADLISGDLPILYFNSYPHTECHLAYERRRVENIAHLLRVKPTRALPLGDFILDFNVFERRRLAGLRSHLSELYGNAGLRTIIPSRCDTLEDRVLFGEWSLYAVYLLDVLQAHNEIRNSASTHLAQVHNQSDLQKFTFDAKIVHFVSKTFDVNAIVSSLQRGRTREVSNQQ